MILSRASATKNHKMAESNIISPLTKEGNAIELITLVSPYRPMQHTINCNDDENDESSHRQSHSLPDNIDDPKSEARHLIDIVDQRQEGLQNFQQTEIILNRNPLSLLHRAKLELSGRYPIFSLRDEDDDNNGCSTDGDWEEHRPLPHRRRSRHVIIDSQRSFAPSYPTAILFRCTWLAYTFFSLYRDSIRYDTIVHYLGYLTHVTHLMTTAYQLTSCFLSLSAADFGESAEERRMCLFGNRQQPGRIVRLVWVVYSIALVFEFIVALVYWTVLDRNIHHSSSLYVHLFIGLILLIDGNVVGRIPIRLKHMLWIFVYGFLYIIWTIIYAHWHMGIRNGVIYAILDWNDGPKQAGVVVSLLALIVTPMIFLFCWLCSLWSRWCTFDGGRRFYKEVYILDSAVNIDQEVIFDENNCDS